MAVAGDVATVGAGVRLGELYDALATHGLTIPAGCGASVGIAGLTLGGGLGILGRKHGPPFLCQPEEQRLALGDLRPPPLSRIQKLLDVARVGERVPRPGGGHQRSVAPDHRGATPPGRPWAKWPREESNLRTQIRSLPLYPLSYGA